MNFKKFYYEDLNTGLSGSFLVPIVPSNIEDLVLHKETRYQNLENFLGMDVYRFANYISTRSLNWTVRGYRTIILKGGAMDKIMFYGDYDGELDPWLGTAGERTSGLMRIGSPIVGDDIYGGIYYGVGGAANLGFFVTASGRGDYMGASVHTPDSISGFFEFLAIDENNQFYEMIIGDGFGQKPSEKFTLDYLVAHSIYVSEDFEKVIPNVESEIEQYEEDEDMAGTDSVQWDDIEKRYSPVASTKGVAMYKMTKEQVQDLFTSLYTKTITENIRAFLGNGNIDGAINSLTFYYHWGKLIKTGDEVPVQIYSQTLDGSSGKTVLGRRILSEYVGLQMGSFNVQPVYNNFLDYSPYTSFLLNVPMYGALELNASDIMSRRINLRYIVDVSKNIGMVFVNLIDGTREYTYKKLQFTPGVDIPANVVTSGNNKLVSMLASIAGGGAGGALGGPVGAMVGANMAGSIADSAPQAHHFSGGSASFGHLDVFTPQLIRIYPSIGPDSSGALGKPVAKTGKIGDFSGYVKTGNITSIGSVKYKDKIESLLKAGVYV